MQLAMAFLCSMLMCGVSGAKEAPLVLTAELKGEFVELKIFNSGKKEECVIPRMAWGDSDSLAEISVEVFRQNSVEIDMSAKVDVSPPRRGAFVNLGPSSFLGTSIRVSDIKDAFDLDAGTYRLVFKYRLGLAGSECAGSELATSIEATVE